MRGYESIQKEDARPVCGHEGCIGRIAAIAMVLGRFPPLAVANAGVPVLATKQQFISAN